MAGNYIIFEWVEVHAALVTVGDLIRHPAVNVPDGFLAGRVEAVRGDGFYRVLTIGDGQHLWILREETVERWERVQSRAVS